jgi:serine/threonine protein kinase
MSANLVKYLFLQLVSGLLNLHKNGFVHRDIKPENLLINKDFSLIIADFNFAHPLEQHYISFSPMVPLTHVVGSEMYNAPELWTTEGSSLYDGTKADIFAAGITLFMITLKMQPFRRAQISDPYFKRLAHKDKKHFWKIFGEGTCPYFRDLFEKMTMLDPASRISLHECIQHKWLQLEPIDVHAAKCELLKIYQTLPE